MQRSTHHWYSPHLEQEMWLNVYGHGGKPVLIFPAQEGRFHEYEDFGMVDVCQPFLDSGSMHLICVDSVDAQSWVNPVLPARTRARRHLVYETYILDEVLPWIRTRAPGHETLLTSGCSMGGYHAANFFFRHPDAFDSVIALSGVYDLNLFIGEEMDDEIYYYVPVKYLPNLTDPYYLERFRQSDIILCVGQGAWEEPMLGQTQRMGEILKEKNVPAWIDIWGTDVSHDWIWWQKQMPYFLEKLGYAGKR